ncbi:CreA family protein [Colwellia echini]|uniref:Catabolite regulation protein CreA n=1 Tax=Colwellia echini TaxID=1982103 RepID=A0ABY3MWX0_9GAMM|nr:CreA family protein [Colwellia echini]TYK65562.1 catabolite regulation protein CreA [Colwellia echini]
MLKKIKIYGAIIILLVITYFIYSSLTNEEVGDVSLGFFTLKDIKLNTLVDPLVPGVTCHIASVEANLSLSDPSDSSISCRQTGEITNAMIAQIDKSKSGEVVFKKSKSIFLKTMKVRRIFDIENQTLMYLSYSTTETSGSFKHSLSTVPLWGTEAFNDSTTSIQVDTSSSN